MKLGTHDLESRLASGAMLILDGAMGTELQRRGIETRLPLWSARALLDAPDTVAAVHRDYVEAGADVITTNTFRSQRRTLAKESLGSRSGELTGRAVELARRAAASYGGVLVAGSMAPLEDCYRPDLVPDRDSLEAEHREMAADLARAGVDLLLVETMGVLDELSAASRAAGATGVPFMVSFIPGEDGDLFGGASMLEAVRAVMPLAPSAVLVNCAPPRVIGKALTKLQKALAAVGERRLPVGAYANMGLPEDERGWRFTDELSPEGYVSRAREWVDAGAAILGGCCGTTPEHIRALHSAFTSSTAP